MVVTSLICRTGTYFCSDLSVTAVVIKVRLSLAFVSIHKISKHWSGCVMDIVLSTATKLPSCVRQTPISALARPESLQKFGFLWEPFKISAEVEMVFMTC